MGRGKSRASKLFNKRSDSPTMIRSGASAPTRLSKVKPAPSATPLPPHPVGAASGPSPRHLSAAEFVSTWRLWQGPRSASTCRRHGTLLDCSTASTGFSGCLLCVATHRLPESCAYCVPETTRRLREKPSFPERIRSAARVIASARTRYSASGAKASFTPTRKTFTERHCLRASRC